MNYKEKGNRYEREIARKLSLWLSNGENKNLLWRSDSSGSRATRSKSKLNNQAGDVKSDSRDGYLLIDNFHIECKHYRNINLDQLIFRTNKSGDNCYTWWLRYNKEAKKYKKHLMLCCKQNNKKELLLVKNDFLNIFEVERKDVVCSIFDLDCNILYLDNFLKIYDPKRLELIEK